MLRVVLIGAEYEENLALRMLAAVLRDRGHRSLILPFNAPQDLNDVAMQAMLFEPDLVGLSIGFQHRAREFLTLAQRLRDYDFEGHLTCGGHFPTFACSELLHDVPALDSVVLHEGEVTLSQLVACLEEGRPWDKLPGLATRAHPEGTGPPQLPELDQLPWPVRSTPLLRHLEIPFAPIAGGRGCWGSCSFCSITAWHKKSGHRRFRQRDIDDVACEMAALYHELGVRIFCFHDDNFVLPRASLTLKRYRRMHQLLQEMGVGTIGLVVKVRPDTVSLDLFRQLKECGLFRAYVGIENGSRAGLIALNRNTTIEQNQRSLEICRDLGIFACYNLLLFEPETTLDDLDENIAFMRQNAYFPYNFCRAEAYLGTALNERLARQGRLVGNYLAQTYECAEQRTEMAFRIFRVAFGARNFDSNGLTNNLMGLAYRAKVLEYFYPGSEAERICGEVAPFVERCNLSSAAFFEELVRFCRRHSPYDEIGVEEFTLELSERINFDSVLLQDEMDQLFGAMSTVALREFEGRYGGPSGEEGASLKRGGVEEGSPAWSEASLSGEELPEEEGEATLLASRSR